MPLKNRNLQIPNGFTFLQPETGWRPRRWSSFDSVVDQVISHRRGNPHLIHTNGWPTDRATVEKEVDNYNTKVCEQMGWVQFIEGGGPMAIPFRQRPGEGPIQHLARSLRNVAAGSVAIVDFVTSRSEAVPDAQANQRAAVCAACPLNTKGNWLALFTVPAATAIRAKLQQRTEMKLSTPQDAQLGVCEACECPMLLKIHFPLPKILKHLTKESRTRIADGNSACWILAEEKANL